LLLVLLAAIAYTAKNRFRSRADGTRAVNANPSVQKTSYSPYWTADAGCVARGADGMTRLTVSRARAVRLRFAVTVDTLLAAGTGSSGSC